MSVRNWLVGGFRALAALCGSHVGDARTAEGDRAPLHRSVDENMPLVDKRSGDPVMRLAWPQPHGP